MKTNIWNELKFTSKEALVEAIEKHYGMTLKLFKKWSNHFEYYVMSPTNKVFTTVGIYDDEGEWKIGSHGWIIEDVHISPKEIKENLDKIG